CHGITTLSFMNLDVEITCIFSLFRARKAKNKKTNLPPALLGPPTKLFLYFDRGVSQEIYLTLFYS
ncbi:hypothetical protein, partial [Bacillus cereus]|uniref:hypothetical protein n=1 Tax=Bacillus cereus TaxID=1396 RepID=UPI003A85215B